MGLHKSPALLVTLIIVISVVTPGFAELRFYLDASARDDGVVTHNILGADFGPEEFNITAQLIFLEPGQDCDSLIPHSMYNGTIDYSALGDFVVYWDMVCKFSFVTRITSNHVCPNFFLPVRSDRLVLCLCSCNVLKSTSDPY
jgi:hypothetical protein